MDLAKLINKAADKIIENKDYLTELDRQIGDGDHGVNLARGFEKLKEQSSTFNNLKLNELFTNIAMTLMSNVGGASGALYSSAFLQVGKYLKEIDNQINKEQICNCLDQFVDAIKSRGNSCVGQKTMLDTLIPSFTSFKEECKKGAQLTDCLKAMQQKAKEGMDSTKDLIATKGRSSYLNERSKGHIDPGSASSYLIIETICDELIKENVSW